MADCAPPTNLATPTALLASPFPLLCIERMALQNVSKLWGLLSFHAVGGSEPPSVTNKLALVGGNAHTESRLSVQPQHHNVTQTHTRVAHSISRTVVTAGKLMAV